jgi:hypothetical protein
MGNTKVGFDPGESQIHVDNGRCLTPWRWLLLHFLKAQEDLADAHRDVDASSCPRSEGIAEIQQLRTVVDQLAHVERALETLDLNEDEYSKLIESRAAGIEAIGNKVYEVICVDPTSTSYMPSEGLTVSLGEGRDLVLFEGLGRELPGYRFRDDAIKWMRERGEGENLEDLVPAIERSVAELVPVPQDCFGMLTLQWQVRKVGARDDGVDVKADRPFDDWLHRLRSAVDLLVRIAHRLESYPGDERLTAGGKKAERRICQIALENEALLRTEKDAAFSCDLGDGRELKVGLIFGIVSSRHRSKAIAWLKARGKKRIEDLKHEMCRAMDADETLPDFLLGHEYVIQVYRPGEAPLRRR